MKLIYSFLFCGIICLIAQIILDHTKLTPGHITSIFVVVGAALDIFNIYDMIVEFVGGGAMVPITSFGHQLIHGGLQEASTSGALGMLIGMLNLTSTGICAAIVSGFLTTLLFNPKN